MERELRERAAARELEAPYCPFTATVTGATVIARLGDGSMLTLYHRVPGDDAITGSTAHDVLSCIASTLGYMATNVAMQDPDVHSVRMSKIFGLRIREKLQLLAADSMRYTALAGGNFAIAPELWCHPNFRSPVWCDPYEVVVPADQRQWVKYEQLAEYLCINQSITGMEQDSEKQAMFASAIVLAANL